GGGPRSPPRPRHASAGRQQPPGAVRWQLEQADNAPVADGPADPGGIQVHPGGPDGQVGYLPDGARVGFAHLKRLALDLVFTRVVAVSAHGKDGIHLGAMGLSPEARWEVPTAARMKTAVE